ncbi:MAG: hypothetical protein QT12_C0034G0005 [archaeon GW2011_AR21]|nr:MAG: hypothetical protein QT12_C0034G0005 [archaeon GW2011_AR21]
MELNVKAISLAAGITAGIVSVICTAAFALAPEQAVSVGSLLMHGRAVKDCGNCNIELPEVRLQARVENSGKLLPSILQVQKMRGID